MLCDYTESLYSDDIIDEGYANTKPKSMLRLYLARSYAHRIIWDNSNGKYTPERLQAVAQKHPDLLADFFDVVAGDQKVFSKAIKNPNEVPRCDYHGHGANEECIYNYSGNGKRGAVQEPHGGDPGDDNENDGGDDEDHYSAPDSGVIGSQNKEDDDGIQVGGSAASFCCTFKMNSVRRGMQ